MEERGVYGRAADFRIWWCQKAKKGLRRFVTPNVKKDTGDFYRRTLSPD